MAKANTGTTVKKVLLRIKRYWFFLILSILMADRGIIFICADFNRKCD